MKKYNLLALAFIFVFTFNSCKTGKKAYQKGNYYLSVIQSVDKLRSNPKNKKAKIALQEAYPLALQTMELNNDNLLLSNNPSKWKQILSNYNKINRMYEEILRSPEALKVIPKPKNHYAEIENVKKNAAEESYALGLEYLLKGSRQDAIKAYRYFKDAQSYIANYKDTHEKLEEARTLATLIVMVKRDPVPANFSVSGNYFRNKIDEYLHASETNNNFIEFYSPEELFTLAIQPDHQIILRYQDFNIGNVYLKESIEQLSKDSVVVATIKRDKKDIGGEKGDDDKGNGNEGNNDNTGKIIICHKGKSLNVSQSALQAHLDHGDMIGPCDRTDGAHVVANAKENPDEYIPVYATVRATLTTFEKTITSKALISMTITELHAGRVLKEDIFPAKHVWISKWGSFNGDERALSEEQITLCNQKEQEAPTRDEIFNKLSEQFYKEVTQNIRAFYQNY